LEALGLGVVPEGLFALGGHGVAMRLQEAVDIGLLDAEVALDLHRRKFLGVDPVRGTKGEASRGTHVVDAGDDDEATPGARTEELETSARCGRQFRT
jgi:hypothetical protein